MAKRQKLSNEDILAAINAARSDSDDADASELVADRADALDRYYGRPYGDEVEGRSSVVSRDISDTIDWIMPSLLRIFAGSDAVVMFNPVGPEDEAQAQQETDYVNHVVTQQNGWFIVGHDWFKDALLLRNGYVKAYWEEYQRPKYAGYTGLSVEQLALVVSEDAEILEKAEREQDGETVYDVKVREYEDSGKACIEAVPPEELVVSRRCRGSVAESPYVEHRPRKTRSDLIEMGLPKDFVEGLPAASADGTYDADAIARDAVSGDADRAGSFSIDQDLVDYREVYIRLDVDGDGVSELRRIVVCGNQIVPGREFNTEIDQIPFASLTPNRIPHRHIGRSVMDEIEDLARIKTTLTRMVLDNGYLMLNQRTVVNENVNISDLLVSRPGGIVRTKGVPGQDVMPMPVMPMMAEALGIIGYVDSVKEFRTGVGRNSQGLDADTLKQATKGAYLAAVGQSNQKVEMIARMFAETGVKDLFLLVHGLLVKNQDKEAVVRLRNEWVPVDPRSWKERYDLTVSVGLGTGSAEEQMNKVAMLAQGQAQLASFGLVGPKEAYASFAVGVKALGFKQASKFAMDPESPEYQQAMANQQPQKDPAIAAKEIEVQGRMAQSQQDGALKKYEIDQRSALEQQRLAVESAQAERDREAEARIEALKAEVTLTVADMKNQVASIGQQLKVYGDAQNRMAMGGPSAANIISENPGETMPTEQTVGTMFEQLAQSQVALAQGLSNLGAQLAQGQSEVAAMLSKPKQVAIQRDAEGRAVGATSKVVE